MAASGRKMLSTVHKGLAFEQRALSLLQNNLSMSLTSVAGRGDGGIDLQGWWWLPQLTRAGNLGMADAKRSGDGVYGSASLLAAQDHLRRKVRVIAQCKAESRKLGPKHVRELEGVVSRLQFQSLPNATPGQPLAPTVAILISESLFTKASTLHAMSSPIPFLLLHLPPLPQTFGSSDKGTAKRQTTDDPCLVGSAVANQAFLGTSNGADVLGLSGKLEIRWERLIKPKVGGERGRLGLWWDRKRLAHWIPPA